MAYDQPLKSTNDYRWHEWLCNRTLMSSIPTIYLLSVPTNKTSKNFVKKKFGVTVTLDKLFQVAAQSFLCLVQCSLEIFKSGSKNLFIVLC